MNLRGFFNNNVQLTVRYNVLLITWTSGRAYKMFYVIKLKFLWVKSKTRIYTLDLNIMIGPQETFDKTKTNKDMQKQDLTIPREPGGGTGTMVSWDTNCIKAILNWGNSLVITRGNRLQRTNIETKLTLGAQCWYTCDWFEQWRTLHKWLRAVRTLCSKKKRRQALSIQQTSGSLMVQKYPGKFWSNRPL